MSYRDVVREMIGKLEDPEAEKTHPCRTCAALTPCKTLSDLGGMCFGCYQAYCRMPQAPLTRPTIPEALANSPKAWAYRLEAREKAGERLTLFQRECWRKALQGHLLSPEGTE